MSQHKEMEGRIGKTWIDAVYNEAAALGYKYSGSLRAMRESEREPWSTINGA